MIKNIIILTIIALVLVGCGKNDVPVEFSFYYQIFNDEANQRGFKYDAFKVPIEFATFEKPNKIGYCGGGGILISSEWWERLNRYSREVLILHELGHCLLSRGHNDNIIDSRYASIMNKYILSSFIYEEYRDYYLNELFF